MDGPHRDTDQLVDHRLLRAMSHPLRQRILAVLGEREASPSDLADQLGERLGNVAYHVKILLECETIELVRTRRGRGSPESFYRATSPPYLDDENWARIPLAVRRRLFDRVLQRIWEHLSEAAAVGGLDAPRTHVSWVELDLDERGYDEAATLLEETLDSLLKVQADAAARRSEARRRGDAPLPPRRTEAVLVHFDRAGDAPARPPERRDR